MPPDEKTVLENSTVYRWLVTIKRVSRDSHFVQLLGNQQFLLAGAVVFVLVSLVRVLLSGLHVTVKFLSFALLTIVLLVLVWPYTKPLTDS